MHRVGTRSTASATCDAKKSDAVERVPTQWFMVRVHARERIEPIHEPSQRAAGRLRTGDATPHAGCRVGCPQPTHGRCPDAQFWA